MELRLCLILVCLTISVVIGKPDCELWSDIEDYLKKNVRVNLCEQDYHCTGLNCSGTMMGGGMFHGGIQMVHCSNPPRIKLFADIPKLSIHNWQHSFVHGENFKISDDLQGELALHRETNNFVVGLKLKLFKNELKNLFFDGSPYLERNILNDAVIPVPSCDSKSDRNESMTPEKIVSSTVAKSIELKKVRLKLSGNCSIDKNTCPENEMCHQLEKSNSDGVCVCIPMFMRNLDGVCMYSPETIITDGTSVKSKESNADKSGNTFLLPLLVTLAVVLLLISLIYTAVRFKIFDYLHRRFRVRVYEHVQLGEDDDNDDQLTDPVA